MQNVNAAKRSPPGRAQRASPAGVQLASHERVCTVLVANEARDIGQREARFDQPVRLARAFVLPFTGRSAPHMQCSSLASHLLVASLRLRALPDALLGRRRVLLVVGSAGYRVAVDVRLLERARVAAQQRSTEWRQRHERRRRHTTPHRQPRVETVGALDDVDELERDSARAALVALAPHEQQVHARQRVGVTQLTVALWCLALLDREAKLIELVAHKL